MGDERSNVANPQSNPQSDARSQDNPQESAIPARSQGNPQESAIPPTTSQSAINPQSAIRNPQW
jgi:hypothetical protein